MKLSAARVSSWWLLLWTFVLCALGLLFVFEASVAHALSLTGNQLFFVRQQAIAMAVGWVGLGVASCIPPKFWRTLSPLFFVVSIILLIMVFIPHIGLEIKGARRWIELGPINFQPVEIVKFSMVIFFANWMEKHQKTGPFLFLSMLPIGLLFLQPDMGSALIVSGIAFGMYYAAGASLKTLAQLGALGIIFLAIMILIAPYRLQRLTTFLDPESDPLGASFHIRQITLALGNGGIFGQGIGKSRQKFSFIPEASTDSIFAIVAEEIGFVGSVFLIGLFGLFLRNAAIIAARAPTHSYDQLLAVGIVLWIGMQILLNLAAVVALVPLTGVPLPFFSFGGTSLVMILWVTGMLLSIGRQHRTA